MQLDTREQWLGRHYLKVRLFITQTDILTSHPPNPLPSAKMSKKKRCFPVCCHSDTSLDLPAGSYIGRVIFQIYNLILHLQKFNTILLSRPNLICIKGILRMEPAYHAAVSSLDEKYI